MSNFLVIKNLILLLLAQADALTSSDNDSLIASLNEKLIELDGLVHCDDFVSKGGLSMDDVDLWSRLRSITIVKGVVWPTKLRHYMDNLSVKSDVPLYDQLAL